MDQCAALRRALDPSRPIREQAVLDLLEECGHVQCAQYAARMAIRRNCEPLLSAILGLGVDVASSEALLCCAVQWGTSASVAMLVDSGAHILSPRPVLSALGRENWHDAALLLHAPAPDMLPRLLEARGNMQAWPTVLHRAIRDCRPTPQQLEQLIAHGAPVTGRDETGKTPLELAAQQRQHGLIDVLLQAGPPPDRRVLARYCCVRWLWSRQRNRLLTLLLAGRRRRLPRLPPELWQLVYTALPPSCCCLGAGR